MKPWQPRGSRMGLPSQVILVRSDKSRWVRATSSGAPSTMYQSLASRRKEKREGAAALIRAHSSDARASTPTDSAGHVPTIDQRHARPAERLQARAEEGGAEEFAPAEHAGHVIASAERQDRHRRSVRLAQPINVGQNPRYRPIAAADHHPVLRVDGTERLQRGQGCGLTQVGHTQRRLSRLLPPRRLLRQLRPQFRPHLCARVQVHQRQCGQMNADGSGAGGGEQAVLVGRLEGETGSPEC
eukprot:scaffold27246_cov114-Isochrysis_galbana.AAC.6